ncbi:MAG: hypothetical protein VZS44_05525 [Bacilli bacterium]|nr:hypothetical protein [Bacilli bacterium]
MKKSIFERIRKAQSDQEIAYVNFLNDGSICEDKRNFANYINKNIKSPEIFDRIEDVFYNAAEIFAIIHKFDAISMELLLGLVYDAENVNDDKTLKENAQPYDGVVRFYTNRLNCYLDGKQVNERDYSGYISGTQGFINFNTLLSSIKKSGLDYDGPESFEELKEAILSGNKFAITITADLTKDLTKEEVVEEKPVQPKRLFRKKKNNKEL